MCYSCTDFLLGHFRIAGDEHVQVLARDRSCLQR
jgi:hypothetical protein